MAELEVLIEEAQASDAIAIQALFCDLEKESIYITETERITQSSKQNLEAFLSFQSQSQVDLCLVVKVNQEVVGFLNMATSPYETSSHIAELFMAIKKPYRGYGLGQDLLEMAVDWANRLPQLQKIELQVQVRNKIARALYETCGFKIEGTRANGVKTKDGECLDLYYMGKDLKRKN